MPVYNYKITIYSPLDMAQKRNNSDNEWPSILQDVI